MTVQDRPACDVPAVRPARGNCSAANPDALLVDIGEFQLDSGQTLPEVTIAVQTWGEAPPGGANAVMIEHALTGDTHVTGPSGPGQPTAGWWPGVVGPGAAIDTDRWFVVAMNALGGCRGSTGPSSIAPDGQPWGSRFPQVTIRDQVRAEAAAARALGIEEFALVVGGSMGGMRAAEWVATYPSRTRGAAIIASCAAATADQIAWGQAQTLAIELDPNYHGGDYYGTGHRPDGGLGIARRIAHTTYRSAQELQDRFGPRPQPGEDPLGDGRFAVEGYLDHHAGKLAARFDAGTYVSLTRAMATHDIGRARGGAAKVLRDYPGDLLLAGVDSDRLFPLALSEEMAAVRGGEPAAVIHSESGHDGFLIETGQVGDLIRAQLTRLSARSGCRVG